ncbi:hypothetical protein [Campylobacter hyointestinalis]|uniref:Uncharacterized protein n=1 Tax=Campylobacter hyointestinalis subsp. hyointestinalis TaxID=91352 RepID=A0A2S5J574_CAMHY|nr:hypothetical protein [Campylobacter hyointestinalis]PPB55458.1 hypothetical protein CDQ67_05295 [Campylobacter hyointestinalis subsp. hyointestinalis]PPB58598.1 hypothetical protein CDQ70_04595 [Campylobacter hyointestinalis subsp. hyointestinalis]PPB61904.1 hypothetical protein CDQ74_07560 [Campylobacter hyointestinalis subsp. hyointestinalis]PPB69682.1 hypothetical protein CDQ76_03290 [Campylobacter hyointestinalis subsp. hyointestinalis]PPB72059.1 hypothetical protein CDQ78_03775 [Campyl
MASIVKTIIRTIDRSSKARARELRQTENLYKKQLREYEKEKKAALREQLITEKQQLSKIKEKFEKMLENSKNMLTKREARRKEIVKSFIENNFK